MSRADQIPAQWGKRRLRFDAHLNPLKSRLDLSGDTEVSFVPMDAVGELGGLALNEVRHIEEIYNGYTYFADGDIVIAKITPCFENGKGALAEGLTNGVAFGTTELHVIRPLPGLDARFLFYLTVAHDFRSFGEAEMLGAGGQKRVPEEFLKDWRAPLPPPDTQHRIARFLDEKTARIDGLIEKKRALLDRLAEKRQALITRAVTKGLNPDVPMKPSGIDWLGDIPAHWNTVPLRWYLRTASGDGLRNEDMSVDPSETDFVPVIGGNGLMGFTSEANSSQCTLVVGRVGALCGNVHAISDPSWITDNALKLCSVREFSTSYLLYTLRVRDLNTLATRNAQPLMTGEVVKAQIIPMPPPNEQTVIGNYIEAEVHHLDNQSTKIDQSLTRLEEYRAAIITAAVTGKLGGINGN